jgi:hypothetical protein
VATIGSIVIGMSANAGPLIASVGRSGGALRQLGNSAAQAQGAINRFGVGKVTAGLTTLGKAAISTHGLLLGLVGGVAVAKLAGGIMGAAKASSDLNEQVSKAKTVFGDATGGVLNDANQMAKAFGYPKAAFIDAASSVGLIAKASGLSQQGAADLGSSFSKLAADASSFYNVPLEDALMSLRSGLVGEAEPMRRFGVLMNAAAVDAEAARQGATKVNGAYTEGAKVQARATLIMQGMADAQGDLERTSGSAANRIRSIWGRLENLGADFGTAIAPATDAVLALADGAMAKLGVMIDLNKGAIEKWAASSASAGGGIFDAFEIAGKGAGVFLDVLHTVKLGFDALPLAGVKVLKWLYDTFVGGTHEAFVQIHKLFNIPPPPPLPQGFAESLTQSVDDEWSKFQAKLAAPPPSEGIKKFFSDTRKAAEGLKTSAPPAAAPAKAIASASEAAAPKVADLEKKLREQIATFGKSSEVADVFKLKLAGATDAQLKTALALAKTHDAMEKSKKIQDEIRTPVQQYAKDIKEIAELSKAGTLTQVQADSAALKAKQDLIGASEKQLSLAGALEAGSKEARSAVLQHAKGAQLVAGVPDATRKAAEQLHADGVKAKLAQLGSEGNALPDPNRRQGADAAGGKVAENTAKAVDLQTKMVGALNTIGDKLGTFAGGLVAEFSF